MDQNVGAFGEDLDRRAALKKAAVISGAGTVAWMAPKISGLGIRPAFAAECSPGVPQPDRVIGEFTIRGLEGCIDCGAIFGNDFAGDVECASGCSSADTCSPTGLATDYTITNSGPADPAAAGCDSFPGAAVSGVVTANFAGTCDAFAFDVVDADVALPDNCVVTSAGTPGLPGAGASPNGDGTFHIDTLVGASTVDFVVVCS